MKTLKCPVTGVDIPKFLLSVVAGFVFLFAYDFVVHGHLLMPLYNLTPGLWRSEADMSQHFAAVLVVEILIALITAFIFTRNVEGKGLGEGLRYGAMIGALLGVMMASPYIWLPISLKLALWWGVAGFVQGIGLGVIYALTYGCCRGACKAKPEAV